MNKTRANGDKKMSQLPGWLWPSSNILPPLYKRIWEAVRENKSRPGAMLGEVLVDTNKIFLLLLTSQLPTEALGYIWSLANHKYSGQLTEQELYVVLALVALAQASYSFNNLDVLHLVRVPPVPTLNLEMLDATPTKIESKTVSSLFDTTGVSSSLHGYQTKTSGSNNSLTSESDGTFLNYNHSSDSIGVKFASSPSSTHSTNSVFDVRPSFHKAETKYQPQSPTDSNDDFSDFQSAPISNVPNVPSMWDSKLGSAIGSRLANHNLGVKKVNDRTKKSTGSKSGNSQPRVLLQTISVAHGKEFQSVERSTDIFPKCSLKNQAKTVILKDTVIRNSDPPEIPKVGTKDFLTTTEKTILPKIAALPKPGFSKNADASQIASSRESEMPQLDLMTLQPTEDKYSALRVLIEEPSIASSIKVPSVEPISVSPTVDDFGEFVSAEQPKIVTPAVEAPKAGNSIDLLTDFDFKPETGICISNKPSPSLIQEISEAFNALGFEEALEQHSEEKFEATYDGGMC